MGGSSNNKRGSALGDKTGGGGTTGTKTPAASPTPLSREFEADRPQIMPVYNSPAQLESARRRREQIMARSGRTSTNLIGNPGTRAYQNSFLGSVA